MREFESSFAASLQSQVTTLCHCWKLTRKDGAILGFTDFDQDLVIAGLTYRAAASFNRSNIADEASINGVSNLELQTVFDDDSISEVDLIKGKYDFAEVQIFMVNYLDLPTSLTASPPKLIKLNRGLLGQFKNDGRQLTASCRSLGDKLNQTDGSVTSRTCRYQLGDEKCTVNLASFTHNCEIASVSTKQLFYLDSSAPQINDYGDQGKLTFTSGENAGITTQILDYDSEARITLWKPLPYLPQPGDTVILVAGCDRYYSTCGDKFDNAINFGGEHGDGNYIPGQDEMARGRK